MFDPKTLRSFIAAADMLHIGRAAQQLGIAQPALSQQILGLEARLQVRLFTRAHRTICLTDAGKVFLEEARRIVVASDRAVRMTRDAHRGKAGELHIGYSGSVIFEPILGQLLRRFRAAQPDVSLIMHEAAVKDLVEALQGERIDLALLRGPLNVDMPEMNSRVFLQSKLLVALPADHSLAAQTSIRLQDLQSEPFITLHDPPDLGLVRSQNAIFAQHGFLPRVVLQAGSVVSVLALVGAGLGVSILPAFGTPLLMPSVALRDLADGDWRTDVLLLSRRSATLAGPRQFMAVFQTMAAALAAAP